MDLSPVPRIIVLMAGIGLGSVLSKLAGDSFVEMLIRRRAAERTEHPEQPTARAVDSTSGAKEQAPYRRRGSLLSALAWLMFLVGFLALVL
jgi:hypothetical protein